MKKLSILTASLFLFVGLCVPVTSQAQTSLKIGPRLGIPVGDVSDIGGNLFIGVDARIDSEGLPVVISPSLDYYFMDDVTIGGESVSRTVFAVDANAFYEFGVDNQAFVPYAGGGLAITRFSTEDVQTQFGSVSGGSDTEVGLNVAGGARFPLGSVEPFAQLNATLGGDVQRLGLTGGLLFGL